MAKPIIIEVELDDQGAVKSARRIKSALDKELSGLDGAGANAGRKIGNALASNVEISLKKIGQQVRQTGQALTVGLTLPILGLGAAVIKTGFDFEKSMNDLTAATKPTNEQLRQATALAKQLGNDLSLPAISANDAAKAMTTLAKSGLTLEQTMQSVKGTLQLASAAQIDSAKAAEIQADAINTFKLQASDAGRVADLLAASANSTSGEITDVADALKQAGSAAALLRIPIEDTVTALGLLAQSGVRGSDAGTSLKSALVQLASPTKAAQETIDRLGLSFFDAQGKLKPLRDLVEEYTSKTANLTDQQKLQTATTLAGTDGQRALNLVLGAGVEQYDKLKKATTEANAAQQLAAAKAQGGIGAYEAFKSALETLALSIFDIIKGPLIALLQTLNQVVQFINELPQPVQTAIVIFTGLAAAIGPLLVVLGSVISAVTTIAALFGTTLTVTLSGVASAILPVIAVLAALAVGAFALYKAWQTNFLGLRDLAQQAFQGIAAFASQQFERVRALFNEILPYLQSITAKGLAAIQKFWAAHGQEIIAVVKSYWEIIKVIVSTAITLIGNTIKLILQVIDGDWKGAWETAKNIVVVMTKAIVNLVNGIGNGIVAGLKLLGSLIIDALKGLVAFTFDIGKQIVQGLINGINASAQFVFNTMKNLASGALNAAKSALGISSPSKEMQIIGEFVGQGFVIGLGKSQPSVETAIRKLVGENLKQSKDEIKTLTAEIGALLAATPKQFQADAQIEQLNTLKESLRELAKLRKELGFSGLSKADIQNFGVAGALAAAQIDKRLKENGGRNNLILDLPNLENPLAAQQAATIALDDKVADLARTFQITREAATNYERALAAINGELKGADQDTKDQLLFFAKQKDAYDLAQQQAEQAKRNIQQITDVFNQAFRDGFEKGPKAFFARIFSAGKETFQRLAANALATLTTQILGGFLNRLGGVFGGGNAQGASGQGGGILGGILGGLLGGNRTSAQGTGFGGFGGGTFGGSIFGSNSSGGIGGLLNRFLGGGSSLAAPASVSAGTLPLNIGLGSQRTLGLTNIASGIGGKGLGGLFGGLFKGIGFGQKAGSGGALAGALPLLGLSLGSSVGGNSLLGQILGGAGGLAVGVGLTAAPTALAGTGLAPLFSNPITAVVGAGLLVGGLLLGRAKQRKADEKLVDTYWVEYMNKTKALTEQVNGDQIEGARALQEALASREEAIALISQIKTKSVRDSRLKNQIPDVDRLFLEPLKAAIEAQKKRAKTIREIIPEFATGGIVPGVDFGFDSVLAMLRPGEVILNQMQQRRMQAIAGGDIFARANVPGFGSANTSLTRNGVAAYALGGIAEARPVAPLGLSGGITLDVTLEIGEDDVTKLFVNGAQTADGQRVTINTVRTARKFREV